MIICTLKEELDKRGMSQLALSQETKLAPSTVGGLYRNQFTRIDCHTAEVLCKYFGLTLGELFHIKDV